jgi:hypothetical protein
MIWFSFHHTNLMHHMLFKHMKVENILVSQTPTNPTTKKLKKNRWQLVR